MAIKAKKPAAQPAENVGLCNYIHVLPAKFVVKLVSAVKKGIKLLDRKNPGWFSQIDVGRLNVRSLDNCVLAQVYGEFADGVKQLHPSSKVRKLYPGTATWESANEWANSHGFDFRSNPQEKNNYYHEFYELLSTDVGYAAAEALIDRIWQAEIGLMQFFSTIKKSDRPKKSTKKQLTKKVKSGKQSVQC